MGTPVPNATVQTVCAVSAISRTIKVYFLASQIGPAFRNMRDDKLHGGGENSLYRDEQREL